jgi:hypothetical protein
LARILSDALPRRLNDNTEERGTYEDWVAWGVNAFTNGHNTWAVEVVPIETGGALYRPDVAEAQTKG